MESSHPNRRKILFFISVLFVLFFMFESAILAQQTGGGGAPAFFEFWKLPRVWVGALFSLLGLFLLMRGKVTRNLRWALLVIVFFVFGILSILPLGSFARGMSLHPSPFCLIEKPFMFLRRSGTVPIIFLSILTTIVILNIIGNKIFCGWVCPVGALQEIVHRIPIGKKGGIKLRFSITNMIRILIFVLFIILLFSTGFSLLAYLNPFEFFHWGFGLLATSVLAVVLVASVFVFRPFCYLVCPLGLFTWIFEHVAFVKVRVNDGKCTKCNICIDKSPCPTIPAILDDRWSRPDCHPCGRCIEVCPEQALSFRPYKRKG